jgi:hypothetical protein
MSVVLYQILNEKFYRKSRCPGATFVQSQPERLQILVIVSPRGQWMHVFSGEKKIISTRDWHQMRD